MAVHRLQLDEEDDDFSLFAIHCGELPFKMAFLMNQSLKWQLKRERQDVSVLRAGKQQQYSKYRYVSRHDQVEHLLLSNIIHVEQDLAEEPQVGLFGGMDVRSSSVSYLMPEFKKVDYLLKIEATLPEAAKKTIVAQIKSIKEVVSTYIIQHNKIRHINALNN